MKLLNLRFKQGKRVHYVRLDLPKNKVIAYLQKGGLPNYVICKLRRDDRAYYQNEGGVCLIEIVEKIPTRLGIKVRNLGAKVKQTVEKIVSSDAEGS